MVICYDSSRKLIQQSSKAAYEKMLILRKQILVETEEVTLVITQ